MANARTHPHEWSILLDHLNGKIILEEDKLKELQRIFYKKEPRLFPIKVIEDGRTYIYHNAKDCALAMEISTDTVWARLRNGVAKQGELKGIIFERVEKE